MSVSAPSSTHITRLLAPFLILFVTALWAGCGGPSSDDVTIEERDGVTYVTNTGTTVWDDHDAAPIQFELEQTFGVNDEPEEAMLASLRGIVVDAEGMVYVLDRGNNRLVGFNPDGSMRWSAGREGEGPGEFSNAYGMAGDGDGRLYVTNQGSTRIDIWTTDGTFVESVNLSEMELRGSVKSYVDDQLMLSGWASGGLQRFHFVDPTNWTLERTIEIDVGMDLHERFSVGVGVTPHESGFWLGHVNDYALGYYAPDGTLQKRIERPAMSENLVGGVMAEDERAWTIYSGISSPHVLPDDHLIVSSWWPANVKDPNQHFEQSLGDNAPETVWASALDLFAPDGRFRGRLLWEDTYERGAIPDIGRIQTIGPDGALYTTTTVPFPQVRRYAVTVD